MGRRYALAHALALDNLRLGPHVAADCVNPLRLTRRDWQAVARQAGTPCLEIEVLCSDPREHQRRIAHRRADIPGHVLPDWSAVCARPYEAWHNPHLVLDTAQLSVEASLAAMAAARA